MAVQPGGGPGDFVIPDALPVLPLRDAVVFPLMAVPLAVGQPRARPCDVDCAGQADGASEAAELPFDKMKGSAGVENAVCGRFGAGNDEHSVLEHDA